MTNYKKNVESFFEAGSMYAPADFKNFWVCLLIILQSISQKTDEKSTMYEAVLKLYCQHPWSH